MLLTNTEHLLMSVAVIGVIAALLIAVADTPAYPLAIGIEITVLLYLLLKNGPDLSTKLLAFINHGGSNP